MFDRLARSWNLMQASWSVLRKDSELLMFPLISALSALVVVACFALPVLGMGALDGMAQGKSSAVSLATLALGFVFYVSLYFVMLFFQCSARGCGIDSPGRW